MIPEQRAVALRQELSLPPTAVPTDETIDAALARAGLVVEEWPFAHERIQEVFVGQFNTIGVSEHLARPWRRWVIVHGLGHHLLHPGINQLVDYLNDLRRLLQDKHEQQAERFAAAFLLPPAALHARHDWPAHELAEHFLVPEEKVWFALMRLAS